jgi:hypothetical protein
LFLVFLCVSFVETLEYFLNFAFLASHPIWRFIRGLVNRKIRKYSGVATPEYFLILWFSSGGAPVGLGGRRVARGRPRAASTLRVPLHAVARRL